MKKFEIFIIALIALTLVLFLYVLFLMPNIHPAPVVPAVLNLKIGDTAADSKIAVTVLSFEKDHFVSANPNSFFGDSSIYSLEAEIKNVGSDSVIVTLDGFSLTDSEGFKYDSNTYFSSGSQEIYPNQKIQGTVSFYKVPENVQGLRILYNFGDSFSGVKLASWEINKLTLKTFGPGSNDYTTQDITY